MTILGHKQRGRSRRHERHQPPKADAARTSKNRVPNRTRPATERGRPLRAHPGGRGSQWATFIRSKSKGRTQSGRRRDGTCRNRPPKAQLVQGPAHHGTACKTASTCLYMVYTPPYPLEQGVKPLLPESAGSKTIPLVQGVSPLLPVSTHNAIQ